MTPLQTEQDLAAAVDQLIAREPRFGRVVARHGLPPLRPAETGLKSLLRIVTDQLISLRAGETIWNRLAHRLDPFHPAAVLACPVAELRELGLSGAKARTFHAAARAFGPRAPLAGTHGAMPDDELMRRLLEISGVGPWTASIYLLAVARSSDAWPAADLALQRAAMDLLSLTVRPGVRDMTVLAEPWRPFRSAAALLLWSHYRGLKDMPQV